MYAGTNGAAPNRMQKRRPPGWVDGVFAAGLRPINLYNIKVIQLLTGCF